MLHPFKQQHLLLQVHRAEALPLEPDGSEPDVHVEIASGLSGSKFATSRLRRTCPQWGNSQPHVQASCNHNAQDASTQVTITADLSDPGAGPSELFVIREDDCLMSGLHIDIRVIASRNQQGGWLSTSSTATIAKAELDLADTHAALLQQLHSGQTALLHIPLHLPQSLTDNKASASGRKQEVKADGQDSSSQVSVAARPSASGKVTEHTSNNNNGNSSGEWHAVESRSHQQTSGLLPAKGQAGLLVISCWLQPTWAGEGPGLVSSLLPPDLQPSTCLPLPCLPPGAVLHSHAATVYNEPCIAYLRVRLLGVWGLAAPKASNDRSDKSLAHQQSSRHKRSHRHQVSMGSQLGGQQGQQQADEGPVTRTAREIGLRLQVQGDALLNQAVHYFSRFKKQTQTEKKQLTGRMSHDASEGTLSHAPSSNLGADNDMSRATSGVPPSLAVTAVQGAGQAVELQETAGSGRHAADLQETNNYDPGTPPTGSMDAPPGTLSRTLGIRFSSSGTTTAAAADNRSGSRAATSNNQTTAAGNDGKGLSISIGTELGPIRASSPSTFRHVVISSPGMAVTSEVSHVLDALEEAGFSGATSPEAVTLPDCTHTWLKLSYDGQEHTSSMARVAPTPHSTTHIHATSRHHHSRAGVQHSQQPNVPPAPYAPHVAGAATKLFGGVVSAAWSPEEPPVLLAMPKPLQDAHPQVELELWASKDVKSRGRSIAKLTTNLPRLLEAAGLLKKAVSEPQPKDDRPSPTGSMIQNMMSSFHSNKEDERSSSRAAAKRGTVNVPSFMDPVAWPQGDVLIQGKLEGGAPIAVALFIEQVDADPRAHVLGLPLVMKCPSRPLQQASSNTTVTDNNNTGTSQQAANIRQSTEAGLALVRSQNTTSSEIAGTRTSADGVSPRPQTPQQEMDPLGVSLLQVPEQGPESEVGQQNQQQEDKQDESEAIEGHPIRLTNDGVIDHSYASQMNLIQLQNVTRAAEQLSHKDSASCAAGQPGLSCQQIQGCVIVWCSEPPVKHHCLPNAAPQSFNLPALLKDKARNSTAADNVTDSSPAAQQPSLHRLPSFSAHQRKKPPYARVKKEEPLNGGQILGYMDLGIHGVSFTSTQASTVQDTQQGSTAIQQQQTKEATSKPVDCYLVIKCGTYWTVTKPRSISPAAASSGGWSSFALKLPLIHPADVLTISLFKAVEGSSSSQNRKASNMRAVIGIHLVTTGDALIGKLRLRPSQFRAGLLHGPVSLPLLGDRGQSKGPAITATCTLSARVTYLTMLPVAGAYLAPPVYGPVLLIQRGCTAGDELSSPFLGHTALAITDEQIERRKRRALLGWLGGVSPPLNYRVARRALEDGRQDFTLSRTLTNWKRLQMILAVGQPLGAWWQKVQSWQQPWLSLTVAICIILAAIWPSRAVAIWAFYGALSLLRRKVTLGEAFGAPPTMVEDSAIDGPLVLAPATLVPGSQTEPGSRRMLSSIRTSRSSYFDPGNSNNGSSSQVEAVSPDWVEAEPGSPKSGTTDSLPGKDAAVTDTSALPSALDAAFWGASTNFSSYDGGSTQATPASPLQSRLATSSGAATELSVPVTAPTSMAVPLDPLGQLRAQYDGMVRFMLTIQNAMDNMAAAGERLQALASWSDPIATGLLLLSLLCLAAAAWVFGVPALIAFMILFDMRPPIIRDPWPAPPANLLGFLPSRGDHMG